MHNCFIETDTRLMNEYEILGKSFEELGFDGFSMTGTGSCFFGVSTDKNIVQKGYNFFQNKYSFVAITNLVL